MCISMTPSVKIRLSVLLICILISAEKQPLLLNSSTRLNYSDNGSLTSSCKCIIIIIVKYVIRINDALFLGKFATRSSLARNRWLVAYTLIRNPSLQELMASRLSEEGENQLETSVLVI